MTIKRNLRLIFGFGFALICTRLAVSEQQKFDFVRTELKLRSTQANVRFSNKIAKCTVCCKEKSNSIATK